MIDKSKRLSTSDFNSMVEAYRPNIIAYAMMLSLGEPDRDAMVLLSMKALWKARKSYHPSSGVGFDKWCYEKVSDAYFLVNPARGVGRDLVEVIRIEAAESLPSKGIRMAAFDRAFFGLSKSEKVLLSISCQHPRLQEKLIKDQKGLDREGYDEQLNLLKSAMLVKCAWKGSFSGQDRVDPSDQMQMNHLAAGVASSSAMLTYEKKLINDPVLRQYFYSCVSLQQALVTRLRDDPSAELRADGPSLRCKHKYKGLAITAIVATLILALYSSTKSDNYLNRGVSKAYYSVVPEPSSVSLLGVGVGMLLLRRCREAEPR